MLSLSPKRNEDDAFLFLTRLLNEMLFVSVLKYDKFFFLIGLFGLTIYFLINLVFLPSWNPIIFSKKLLFIGVFSSPEHFEQRFAIRKTWLNLINNNHLVNFKFVIGEKMCAIHPNDRKDQYGCQRRRMTLNNSITTSSNDLVVNKKKCFMGFHFKATYNLTITQLAIPDCLLTSAKDPMQIIIKSIDGAVLTSATFTNFSPNKKSILPVTFPQHSEGIILLKANNKSLLNCCFCLKRNSTGINVINVIDEYSAFTTFDELKSTGSVPIIYYKIWLDHTEEKNRELSWHNYCQNVTKGLQEESAIFGDIMLLNLTDVYSNLPSKLLEYLQSDSNANYKFLAKFDDDSFIDIIRVVDRLQKLESETQNMWWWSSFKLFQHVHKTGKWREDKYKSATYPPFPCGGGYLLSWGTVSYLKSVAKHLTTFQGEDVSLGIWLSGVNIVSPVSSCTTCQVSYKYLMSKQCEQGCEWVCDSQSKPFTACNRVQLSIPQMYALWRSYKRNGHI